MFIHNVSDKRYNWFGSWEIDILYYDKLTEHDIGRTVVYQDHSGDRREAGTISSFRDNLVFVRFTTGDTAAACSPLDLFIAHNRADTHPNTPEGI